MIIAQLRRNKNVESKTQKPGSGKRLDIQGLRAFAVLVVVADHLWHWPTGGFAGVDVFFVISGFLITGLLLREWEKTERISARNFYVRRAKRILPAAVLTIAATLLVARYVLTGSRVSSLDLDGFFALVFAANWRSMYTGTDYFNAGDATSALQHFWSLSIEEQFYFVWPWLLLLALTLMAIARVPVRWDRRVAAAMIGAISLASFGWAMLQSTANPTSAYFSSLTRVWELGLGALLACVAPLLTRLPKVARPVLLWVGLAGLFISLFVITTASTWPAPMALLPVLSTMAVIASGTGGDAGFNPILTNRPAQYVGDLSYSLYLWHFPVIILYGAYETDHDWKFYTVTLVLIAILSAASYHAVEKPIHTSPLGSRPAQEGAWRAWKQDHRGPASVALTGLVAVIAFALGSAAMSRGHVAAGGDSAPITLPTTQASGAEDQIAPAARGAQTSLTASLAETTWPTLKPSVDSLPAAGLAQEFDNGCSSVRGDGCEFGSGDKTMAVYGDSLGVAFLPVVRAAYGDTYKVKGLTQISCAVTELDAKWSSDKERNDCLRARSYGLEWIKRNRPDTVFVTQNYAWAGRLNTTSGVGAAWKRADTTLINAIKPYTKHIVFVASTVSSPKLVDCATPRSTPRDCVARVSNQYRTIHNVEENQLPEPATFFDYTQFFCVQGYCPAFSGTTPVLADGSHPTRQYAQEIAPAAKKVLDGLRN